MVKKVAKSSISEDDGDSNITNENGKRPSEEGKDVKKRLKTKSLYRQPTVNELNRLQETESLFNSNLFRLQVEEILQEVKVKEKTTKRFQEWFAKFKNHLMTIPDDDTEYDLTEKTLSKRLKVKIPVSSRLDKTKAMFKFHKFSDIEVVGSYSLETAINSKLIVDIQITVPAENYTKNDSINYRYHKKRAAYLAYITSHINKYDDVEDLKFLCLNGSEGKPVLELKPKGKLGTQLSVHINLACEEVAYKLHRFSPVRNNLREAWMFSEETQENNAEIGPPTPYYNSSVLADLTASINHQFLKEIFENSDNLQQAVVLLKIWLRQRKLQVSGQIVSLFVAHLVLTRRINNIMSSYQIIRNVWIALISPEWDTKGISLRKETDTPPIGVFLQHFPVVFLDRTGYYNVCWQMCRGTYCALRRESALAVDMLDNGKINSFIPLFMTPVLPLMQFDHILLFKDLAKIKESVLERTPKQVRVNYGVDELALVTDVIYALLRRGLGDRVHLILQTVAADFSWPVNKTLNKAKKDGYEQKLSFGFILNPENAMNIVDKGPPANLPEAEEFRGFWGARSELRRFQDGAITEAVVWAADTPSERRAIAGQVVDYLMQLKYDIPATQLFHVATQLDSLTARKALGGLPAEVSAVPVLQAFDELRRDLRGLTEMPLDVSAVYGVSPVFSYCEPFPGAGSAPERAWRRGHAGLVKDGRLPRYTPANCAVVELGHSGKWPGDVEAFRCVKAALGARLGERLGAQCGVPAHAHREYLDVLKHGRVFRLRIAHPKEITLLRRELENGVVKFKESEESVRLQCDTMLLPRLRGALHGLHQKHPAFGPTVCLFKRWLAAHLLSPPHFPTVVAELLTAATFVHCAPLTPPAQPTAGLVRVLRRLVDTDWTREMVVLDFNEDMTREEITDLERKFNSRESATPHMYIVTAYDGELPSVWSHAAPTGHVLRRAQTLARATLDYVERALMVEHKDNILDAFVPSLSGYDVLIYLDCSLVPYATERVDRPPVLKSPPEEFASDVIPVVEFNPVEKYLEELRAAYSEFAVFFHDAYGGDVIAVLWTPDVQLHRELQIGSANALKPVTVNGETRYRVNLEALVEDFRLLGTGLVRDIVVNS